MPVPLCPAHDHALVGVASGGDLTWSCPDGLWDGAFGEYEARSWPQIDVSSLAPDPVSTAATAGNLPGRSDDRNHATR